jgi:signal-transduction protein with cAMP-binding, CBS, and nucleotidyltransferase domain
VAPDDFIDPASLGTIAKSGLKEAFRVIARAQRQLASELGVDIR